MQGSRSPDPGAQPVERIGRLTARDLEPLADTSPLADGDL